MRVFAALASLVALATAAPCRQAWMVIPRGGGSEYGSELEVVKSSVLEKASESVSATLHFSLCIIKSLALLSLSHLLLD
jgi:hypothetical protein